MPDYGARPAEGEEVLGQPAPWPIPETFLDDLQVERNPSMRE